MRRLLSKGLSMGLSMGLWVAFAGTPSTTFAGTGGLETSGEDDLPIPVPERPFLLLDAPRRFTPSHAAWVRVQLRGGGRVRVAVFRVHDPAALLARPGGWRQGVSVAGSPLGKEAERLVASSGRVPRKGALLTLVRWRTVRVSKVRRPRRVKAKDEAGVYDSYEDEESVATYWVRREQWGRARASLGRLPAGLYLVRAHRGSWATAAFLSVGRLTLLVRRGDLHDQVLVTDGDGAPQAGVPVEVRAAGRRLHLARTGVKGMARLPGSDTPTLRYLAHKGVDFAWSDVTHARLSECDPRIYLATGRPVYRPDETIYIRGHVRGCTDKGFAPLAGEPVVLWPGRARKRVTARTDKDGNFTAELVAGGDGKMGARVRGRDHLRDVQIDHRALPQRALRVHLDRPWAAAGQLVAVTVADDQGGWPQSREVTLHTPAGLQRGRIGPGRPARFQFRVPAGVPTLEAVVVSATVTLGFRTTTATTQLWVGSRPEVVHLHADRTWAKRGESIPVRVTAANLGGEPVTGAVQLSVRGSDGNRPRGAARWRRTLALPARGLIPLRGAGPWWVEARRGEATSSLVVWDRPRPPSLSARGPLAVRPLTRLVRPNSPLLADVRLKGRGQAWVTLEQGSVWSSAMVRGGIGKARVRLQVPQRARGMASIVVSQISRGRVRTTTATVEVATSRQVSLSVNADRRVYSEGAKAHVTIQAVGASGRPRDAVVSLWLADAGYWELGQDRYPAPGDFFALPGRMSSAGDSTRPVAFGAEEGRHVDAVMEWNGKRVPKTTFRHAWGHGGGLVNIKSRGGLTSVARRLARAAGLAGAWVCPQAVRAAGRVSLRTRSLPWDLVAIQVADRTNTTATVRRRVLRFECGGSGYGLGSLGTVGKGGGGGAGCGYGRSRGVREQQLEGTLRFIGLGRLGPDGRLELDLPLPRHPGRWRVEVLGIADDGGGDRGHAIVHTVRSLVAAIELPTALRPGDETHGEIRLVSRGTAKLRSRGKTVELRVKLPASLGLLSPLPKQVTLDSRGAATVPLRVRAKCSGAGAIVVRARARSGRGRDTVQRKVVVRTPATSRPVRLRAIVGPDATDVRLKVPPLARRARLHVVIDRDPTRSIREVLDLLRRPRWNLPVMALDRLASLRSLSRSTKALAGRPGNARERARLATLRQELSREIEGELAALEELQAPDGAVSWWTTLRSSTWLTALTLLHTGDRFHHEQWRSAMEIVRHRTRSGRVPAAAVGPVAAVLSRGQGAHDKKLARRLLQRHQNSAALLGLDNATWALRAAYRLKARDLQALFGSRIAVRVKDTIQHPPVGECAGPIWFLCFTRHGREGQVARAVTALLEVGHPGARALAARAAGWLARRPTDPWWMWGTAEADLVALLTRLGVGERRPRSNEDEVSALLARFGGRSIARRKTRFTVLFDGRRAAAGKVGAPARLDLDRAGLLVVRFPAATGRAVRLRIDGTLAVRPPAREMGPARLQRRLFKGRKGWSAEISFSLARDERAVDVGIPLPAGLEQPGDPASRTSMSHRGTLSWQSWIDVGNPRVTRRPRLWTSKGGELRLRWGRLRAGRHRVRIRLSQVARGSFQVASAWLRTGDGRTWGLTRPTRVQVGSP